VALCARDGQIKGIIDCAQLSRRQRRSDIEAIERIARCRALRRRGKIEISKAKVKFSANLGRVRRWKVHLERILRLAPRSTFGRRHLEPKERVLFGRLAF